jgi:hypothetical protein
MHASYSGQALTDDECAEARREARDYSERLAKFYRSTGILPPLLSELPVETGACAQPGCTSSQVATGSVCCRFGSEFKIVSLVACNAELGGAPTTDPLDCSLGPKVCCVTGAAPPAAAWMRSSECESLHASDPNLGGVLPGEQCVVVCRPNPNRMSRYQCEQTGGTPAMCPSGPPL